MYKYKPCRICHDMLSNVQVDLFETCEDSLLCSLWREKTQKNSFLPDMLEVHAQKNK